LVTGAGRRLGRAIAVALGSRGMRVAVHYHGAQQGAQETATQIREAGGEAFTLRADLREGGAPRRLGSEAGERLGTLDVLVNSAAVMIRTPLEDVTETLWDEISSWFTDDARGEADGSGGCRRHPPQPIVGA